MSHLRTRRRICACVSVRREAEQHQLAAFQNRCTDGSGSEVLCCHRSGSRNRPLYIKDFSKSGRCQLSGEERDEECDESCGPMPIATRGRTRSGARLCSCPRARQLRALSRGHATGRATAARTTAGSHLREESAARQSDSAAGDAEVVAVVAGYRLSEYASAELAGDRIPERCARWTYSTTRCFLPGSGPNCCVDHGRVHPQPARGGPGCHRPFNILDRQLTVGSACPQPALFPQRQ